MRLTKIVLLAIALLWPGQTLTAQTTNPNQTIDTTAIEGAWRSHSDVLARYLVDLRVRLGHEAIRICPCPAQAGHPA